MGKRLAILWLCAAFFLLLGVEISEAFKSNPVKCHDSKNFPTCFKNINLYCPKECPWSCTVDCAKCRPVCNPPPKSLNPNKNADCNDKKKLPQSPQNKPIKFPPVVNHPLRPEPPKKQQINFPPHMSFNGYSTPPPKKQINIPPQTPFKGYSTPPPKKQISYPPQTPVKGYSSPPPMVNPPPTKKETESPGLATSKASSTPPRVSTYPRTARCRNKNYTKCYLTQHKCPPACPDHCEVDCAKCSPVCSCNYPGAVCKDPRFVGADGITFYFHGKKNQDFCIVSDHNLHINAHFIGVRNHHMTRDFTWIQSLGIRFGSNNISIAALHTSTWDDTSDRLSISFNGQSLEEWGSPETDLKVVFIRQTNSVVIEAKDLFQIKANVVPITQKESNVHGYGIDTDEDCFAHLDLSFKFYSLSEVVDGVLGQTYASNYVSRVKMGVAMPVLGGNDKFLSSSIFATDCIASRFSEKPMKL
ncbi:uncharacterized protein LOC124913149 [Impatiens glandulifera]|uniref:uncharacterized protein LOC124913149 n=1 Tax=Impatiens glandulifera TaxID=253017 RepID=UPI001FB087B2|nr:uncharacterized protein LOC124913149 [Impatiens glandulifera]